MSNDTEEFIEVENEPSKEFENDVEKPSFSEGCLDTHSDATTYEATSGSSIEDIPSSKQCKNCVFFHKYLHRYEHRFY